MTERLSLTHIAMLVLYAAGMALGQILFKAAASRVGATASLGERALMLVGDWFFLSALVVYFALTLFWVWILTFTPLSRAYPFSALAFAVTPVFAALLFDEPLSLRLIVGILIILVGLTLVGSA